MADGTVKIVSSDPASQGPYVTINKSDFDSKVHRLYGAGDESSAENKPAARRGKRAAKRE